MYNALFFVLVLCGLWLARELETLRVLLEKMAKR